MLKEVEEHVSMVAQRGEIFCARILWVWLTYGSWELFSRHVLPSSVSKIGWDIFTRQEFLQETIVFPTLLWHSPPTSQFWGKKKSCYYCAVLMILCSLVHWVIQRFGNGCLLHSFYGSSLTHLPVMYLTRILSPWAFCCCLLLLKYASFYPLPGLLTHCSLLLRCFLLSLLE